MQEGMYYWATYPSPVGLLTLASDGDNLCGLWIEGQKYHGTTLSGENAGFKNISVFEDAKKWLDKYFAGDKPAISELPLAPCGGAFRQNVWKLLCKIPYGKVSTYGDIAKKMALKMNKPTMSSRAVGGAIAHNPISIIIPCHRVIGANGNLRGYAGGINIKAELLKLEGAMTGLFTP
ncbi:MAG: methylated-DNA--[protein]-cysteine S-methyltransferase [Termitinemataceae bacterium]|nr:MAG: methylated-DNA--[protein]-cysteine S-methyltransferase [Termitinemataceae bacterium]